MSRPFIWLAIVICAAACPLQAQQSDSVLLESNFDELLSLEDSLSIFNLIDSLIRLEASNSSQLAVRLSYTSNAASANRSLGISQFGLSPGVSYYHKSGAYLDASGYWSTEYDPNYYLTVLSGGYIGAVTPWWSFLGEYSRYLYSNLGDSVVISYKNSVGVSNFFDVKPFTFRLDYTLLFGEKTGHRILPGVMLNLEKRNWRKLDRILFYPSFNVLLGRENYYIIEEYPPIQAAIRERFGLPTTYEVEARGFGVMNYSFSAPLSVSVKNWNFLLSYTFNIPKALPREETFLSNSGFISASITKYLRLKK